jgi:hypothetical protein
MHTYNSGFIDTDKNLIKKSKYESKTQLQKGLFGLMNASVLIFSRLFTNSTIPNLTQT